MDSKVTPSRQLSLLPLDASWDIIGDIDGESGGDESGRSVASSSDGFTIAIGAPGNDGTMSEFSIGHVRVYTLIGTTWVQKGADIDGEAIGDHFGWSVSLSSDGNIVAIGGKNNDENGSFSGHVRVYEWVGTAWVQKGADIDGEAENDNSGWSVSLSSDGTVVAIGAIWNDGNGNKAGHVRVYEWAGTAWVQKGADIDGEAENDNSGWSVSLSSDGTIVAIGATLNDGSYYGAGHVRVYEWIGTAWVQKGADIDGEAENDNSAWSLSLSDDGNIVAIGAPYRDHPNNADFYGISDNNAGGVRVFEYIGTDWVQKGGEIYGQSLYDWFGYSVSLSGDGNVVAIGSIQHDNDSGHVRVLEWDGTDWTQRGDDINGVAANDRSGHAVSLSSNGNIVAIGATYHAGTGHVRVLRWNEATISPTAAPSTSVPTIVPTTSEPTILPTTVPSTVPTISTTIIVESPHNHDKNMNEKWVVSIPGATCYTVTMDPQSWTQSKNDFVLIWAVNNGVRTPFRDTKKRLFKRRLSYFPETTIAADSLEIEFKSDAWGTSWGFRAFIDECN